MSTPLFIVVLGPRGFQLLLVASQVALVMSVLVLLLIWWQDWRHGQIW